MFITKAIGLTSINLLTMLKKYNIQRYPEVVFAPNNDINPKINGILSSIDKSKSWVITSFSRGPLQRNEVVGNRRFDGYDSRDIGTAVRNVSLATTFNFISNSLATLDRIEELFILYYDNDSVMLEGNIDKDDNGNIYKEVFFCKMSDFNNSTISEVSNTDYGGLYQYSIEFKLEFSVEDKTDGGPTPRIHRIYVNDELACSIDHDTSGFSFKFLS